MRRLVERPRADRVEVQPLHLVDAPLDGVGARKQPDADAEGRERHEEEERVREFEAELRLVRNVDELLGHAQREAEEAHERELALDLLHDDPARLVGGVVEFMFEELEGRREHDEAAEPEADGAAVDGARRAELEERRVVVVVLRDGRRPQAHQP